MRNKKTKKNNTKNSLKGKSNENNEKKSEKPEIPNEPSFQQSPFRFIDSTPDYSNPLILKIKSLLGNIIKIELIDGRTIIGGFSSIDNLTNITLSDAYQIHVKDNKRLGLILVPGKSIKSLYLSNKKSESLEGLKEEIIKTNI